MGVVSPDRCGSGPGQVKSRSLAGVAAQELSVVAL